MSGRYLKLMGITLAAGDVSLQRSGIIKQRPLKTPNES